MAEIDTTMLSLQHGDIRREGAEHASELRYDIATKAGDIRQEATRNFADGRFASATETADDMAASISSLNAQNYETFIASRTRLEEILNSIKEE